MPSITINIIGGTPIYHVELISGGLTVYDFYFGTSGVKVLNNIECGDYIVKITDPNGCTDSQGGVVLSCTTSTEEPETTTSSEPEQTTTSSEEEVITTSSPEPEVTTSSEEPVTTTTSTEALPYCVDGYIYNVDFHACDDCTKTGAGTICNIHPLHKGKWYYDPNSQSIIHVTNFVECGCAEAGTQILTETKKSACVEIECPTTTTTTEPETTTTSTEESVITTSSEESQATTTSTEPEATTTTEEPITTSSTEPEAVTTTTCDPSKCDYGLLYNWYAVDTGKLAPTDWHVPTDAEFETLRLYVASQGWNYDGTTDQGTTISNKQGKALAGTCGWNFNATTGAVGNTDYTDKRNISGFSGLPDGLRFSQVFNGIGYQSYWWSSTESSTTYAYAHSLNYSKTYFYSLSYYKNYGYYIRCVRDTYEGWEDDLPVVDYDGNEYDVVEIGTQLWLVQNLKTTHYNDGESIPNIDNSITWDNLTTGALCAYNNDWETYACVPEPTTTSTEEPETTTTSS